MTPQNNLEVKGNILDHPLAEILAEIAQSALNGSLKLVARRTKNRSLFRRRRCHFCRFKFPPRPAFSHTFTRRKNPAFRTYKDSEFRQ